MPRPHRWIAAALVGATLLSACGRSLPPQVGTESVAPADRGAPLAISGPTLDGGSLDLADLRGSVVVLNDWASWCGPCRDETPTLVHLSQTVDPASVRIVGLNVKDEPAAAQAFTRELGVTYPSIVDPEGALLATIPGVPPAALPSTVVLDRQGRIAARIIGAVDPGSLAGLVSSLEAEPATSPASG